ncbi:MAG: hypothetical protein ACRBN8_34345 [Nannocystales bacterium]
MTKNRKTRLVAPLLALGIGLSVPSIALALNVAVGFDQSTVGQEFNVGANFALPDADVRFMRFRSISNTWAYGEAEITDDGEANGFTPKELQMANITVRMTPSSTATSAKFKYADCGGSVNLSVNGQLSNVQHFSNVPSSLGGTTVSVSEVSVGGCRVGVVEMLGNVDVLRFGGQELFVDDITLDN